MKFSIILLIVGSFLSDHRVAAQCDVCNYGYEYPIELPLQLGTVFHGCIVNLIDKVTQISNSIFILILSPERPVPVLPLIQKWESLPYPNYGNVIGSALRLLGFDLQPLLEIILPSALINTPIDVYGLVKFILSSIPPDTQTITAEQAIHLIGAYLSQYFIQRVTDLLNSLPAL